MIVSFLRLLKKPAGSDPDWHVIASGRISKNACCLARQAADGPEFGFW